MRFSCWLLSLLVHLAIIALALKMPMSSSSLQIDLDKPVYEVDLVRAPEKRAPEPQKGIKEPVAEKEQAEVKEPSKAQKKAQPIKAQEKKTEAKPEAKPISPKKTKELAKKEQPKASEVKAKPKPKEQEKPKKAMSPAAPTPEQVLSQALDAAQENIADDVDREALYQELAKLREDVDRQSGSAQRGSGSGSGSGASEALQLYARIVEQRIKSHWRFPRIGTEENLQAVVEVKIDAQGNIIETNLVSGSGRNDFDNSVLRAVEETEGLSAPPGKEINSIKFTFNLQE